MRMIYWVVQGAAAALAPSSSILTKLQLRYGANFAPFEEDAVSQFTNAFNSLQRGGNVFNRMNRTYDNMFGNQSAGPYDGVYVHDLFTDTDT